MCFSYVNVTLRVYYCANSLTHFDSVLYVYYYLVSFLYFSCLMKLITASSKHCNKVCEQFEQYMCEYRAGYNNHCYYDPQVVYNNYLFLVGRHRQICAQKPAN